MTKARRCKGNYVQSVNGIMYGIYAGEVCLLACKSHIVRHTQHYESA